MTLRPRWSYATEDEWVDACEAEAENRRDDADARDVEPEEADANADAYEAMLGWGRGQP